MIKLINFLNLNLGRSRTLTKGFFRFFIREAGYIVREGWLRNESESLSIEPQANGLLTHDLEFRNMMVIPKQGKGSIIGWIPIIGDLGNAIFRFRVTGTLSDFKTEFAPLQAPKEKVEKPLAPPEQKPEAPEE